MSKEIISKLSVGDKVGMLTILEIIPGSRKLKRIKSAICLCDCGKKCTRNYHSMRYGHVKSCGCWQKNFMKTHGNWRTPEYRSWEGMKQRCLNKNAKGYKNYGGRGIKVCGRWMEFKNFLEDMGKKPKGKHSIDRINNEGNYEPLNCRWATDIEQASNQRRTSKC